MITHDRDQADWGSTTKYADGTKHPFNADKVVIHWGGGTDPDGPDNLPSEAEEAAILRGWQRYHINSKGWTDIAYNTAIGNTGLKYRCRGYNRSGATSGDIDGDGIPEGHEAYAFVWIGGLAGTPSDAAYNAMGEAIREFYASMGWDPADHSRVTVHSDHKATQCPGPQWRAWVNRRDWLNADTQDPDPPPSQPEDTMDMPPTIWYGDGAWRRPPSDAVNPRSTDTIIHAVGVAQALLTIAGFIDEKSQDTGAFPVDRLFGSGTRSAVEGFQISRKLDADGICGPLTWTELILG